jgi:hypothetical protein
MPSGVNTSGASPLLSCPIRPAELSAGAHRPARSAGRSVGPDRLGGSSETASESQG